MAVAAPPTIPSNRPPQSPPPRPILSPGRMWAENRDRLTVTISVSELDAEDGITVNKYLRRNTVLEEEIDTIKELITDVNTDHGVLLTQVVTIPANSVAGVAGMDSDDLHWSVRAGLVEVAEGTWDEVKNVSLKGMGNVNVVLSLTVDNHGPDNTKADGVDDRAQKAYSVYLETAPGSDLYKSPETYWTNPSDDVAKLVNGEKYVSLPGLDDFYAAAEFDYVYQYRIDGDKIYGEWVEETKDFKPFSTSTTNDKDTNGDGKVSCDEYYGTTGLEWSDKLNACVVSSTGDAVVTIPNTATK